MRSLVAERAAVRFLWYPVGGDESELLLRWDDELVSFDDLIFVLTTGVDVDADGAVVVAFIVEVTGSSLLLGFTFLLEETKPEVGDVEIIPPKKLVFESSVLVECFGMVDEDVVAEEWRSLFGGQTVAEILLVTEVEDVNGVDDEFVFDSENSPGVVAKAKSWLCDLVRFLSNRVSTVLLVRSSIELVENRLVIRLILFSFGCPMVVVDAGMIWSMVMNLPWFSFATK